MYNFGRFRSYKPKIESRAGRHVLPNAITGFFMGDRIYTGVNMSDEELPDGMKMKTKMRERKRKRREREEQEKLVKGSEIQDTLRTWRVVSDSERRRCACIRS